MKKNKQDQQSLNSLKTSTQKIGNSYYVINNSFIAVMNPKRSSVDINSFLQIHRKRDRKSLIQKQFQTGLDMFNNEQKQIQKGFRGSLCKSKQYSFRSITQNSPPKSNILKLQDAKSTFTDRKNIKLKTQNVQQSRIKKKDKFNTYEESYSYMPQQTNPQFVNHRITTAINHQRPNLMYNLNLYRKKYKHLNYHKNDSIPKTISNRHLNRQNTNESKTANDFKGIKTKIELRTTVQTH